MLVLPLRAVFMVWILCILLGSYEYRSGHKNYLKIIMKAILIFRRSQVFHLMTINTTLVE